MRNGSIALVVLQNDWDALLKEEFQKSYYLRLHQFLKEEYAAHTIYPAMQDIFNALRFCSYAHTTVVILGQDPYHGAGQAHGLAFSVNKGVEIPPSLRNIYKELHEDLGLTIPANGYLKKWAEQGVLLLNTSLTVRAGQANSHSGKGWEVFTDHVISLLNEKTSPVIFLLWGRNAKAKASLITNPQHCLLTAAHPSPLSASSGFFGCRHFSKANTLLAQSGAPCIDWQIED